MKPYNKIKKALDVVNDLKYKLQFSKNRIKDGKDINTLLDALKSFDDMLVYKYKTDAIETLLYSLIYEYLLMHKAYRKEIPLNTIIYNIDKDIENGSRQKKAEVISILRTHELQNKINNNSVFDKNYANFDKMINNLINEFKMNILWTSNK